MKYEFILYLAFLFALVLSLYAQIKVSSTFKKYSSYFTGMGRNAADAAHMILSANGLYHVRIERVSGHLTDHFDPRANVLRLSDSVYSSSSAAAVGVAAHEAGHAIQHAQGYVPIIIRRKLVPITNFASRISWIVILLGMVISFFAALSEVGSLIALFGVGLFSVTAVFQLVTLPCEFNASRRALRCLEESGWYNSDEIYAAKKVLSAAALTYVAALFVTVIQVLRLLLIFGRRRK